MVYKLMYFREHSCIFFHIPKTAGVSVELWLGRDSELDPAVPDYERLFGWDAGTGYPLQHITPDITLELLGAKLYEESFRFTIVRNPYARLLSSYYYQHTWLAPKFGDFTSFVRELPKLSRQPPEYKNAHFLPQVRYTQLNGQPACHEVLRFEDLPDCIAPIAERLGITRPLPYANFHRHPLRGSRPISSFYSAETARLLAEVYAEDFEAFGYPTELEAANENAAA